LFGAGLILDDETHHTLATHNFLRRENSEPFINQPIFSLYEPSFTPNNQQAS
jgi:hypothetical protein